MFNKLSKVLLLLCIIALGVSTVRSLSSYLQNSLADNPYCWQDEGYVIEPALRVYKNGFGDFRCRENNPSSCYGSTQVFLDAALLKILPDKFVTSQQLLPLPGTRWFFLPDLPNALKTLRLSRVFHAFFLLLLVLAVARFHKFNWPSSIGMALILGGSHTFIETTKTGLKNDFPATLWLLALLFLSNFCFKSIKTKKAAPYFIATVLAGTLATGVKFSIIAPLVFFVFTYTAIAVSEKVKYGIILRNLAFGLLTSVIAYLLFNPNFWINSSEASWFLIFTAVSEAKTDLWRTWIEFKAIAAPSIWPIIFLGYLSFRFLKKPALVSQYLTTLYFIIVPLFLIFSAVRAAWIRPPYYLPALAWILCVICLWSAKLKETSLKVAVTILVFVAAMVNIIEYGNPIQQAREIINPFRQKMDEFYSILNQKYDLLVIDSNLRPALQSAEYDKNKAVFFDPLTETPKAVLQKISAVERKVDFERSSFFVTCFNEEWGSNNDNFELASPAWSLWKKFINSECADFELKNNKPLYPFENGYRPIRYAAIPLSKILPELRSASLKPLLYDQSEFNPRFFVNAMEGLDYWFSPLVLYKDTLLFTDLSLKKGLKKLDLALESYCKKEGHISVKLSQTGSKEKTVKIPLNITEELCKEFPLVCKIELQNWWTKRYPISASVPNLNFKPGKPVKIEIKTEGLDESCRIAFKSVKFL